jgi:hypothetical protein
MSSFKDVVFSKMKYIYIYIEREREREILYIIACSPANFELVR